MIFKKKNKGYTLLFAVLTAALVLGVTVFILSVSRKQFILSTTARESTFAIYAADSGIECMALHGAELSIHNLPDIKCNGTIISVPAPVLILAPPGFQGQVYQTPPTFSFVEEKIFVPLHREVTQNNKVMYGCATISIVQGLGENGNTRTVIESRGYNYCTYSDDGTSSNDAPDIDNVRTVERALRLIYD